MEAVVRGGRVIVGDDKPGATEEGPETLGRMLRDVRVAGVLRQEDLANAIGVAVDRISHIENDRSPLPLPLFVKWCAACKAKPEHVIKAIASKVSPDSMPMR